MYCACSLIKMAFKITAFRSFPKLEIQERSQHRVKDDLKYTPFREINQTTGRNKTVGSHFVWNLKMPIM